MSNFHSGFVPLIGRPNVGKSTLMNLFIGEKISIVTNKPQTTRNKIRCILTRDDYQIIFIDTPGMHTPQTKLGDYMMKSASSSLNEVDAIIYMVEPRAKIHPGDTMILEQLKKVKSPVFLAINKIDQAEKPELLKVIDEYNKLYDFKEIIPISALRAESTDELLNSIRKILPEGPQFFPDDMITDSPERVIAAEIIREKALTFLQEEIPHGVAVEITRMRPREDSDSDLVDIEATIHCERESHKAIIIGKKGEMLKKIGTAARHDIQRLLGSPIYLELWVKVKKNWRDNAAHLRNFGYRESEI